MPPTGARGTTIDMRPWLPALVLTASACGRAGTTPPPAVDGTAPSPTAAATATATAPTPGGGGAAAPSAPAVLAAAPRLDLDANRPRWHVYDRGLVIDLGGEALRKYDLAYRSPWSEPSGGARRAKGKATLTVPWLAEDGDGPATLTVRGRDLGKLSARLDGARLAAPVVDGDAATFAIAAGALTAGEHALTLEGKGALASIELAPDAAGAACASGSWRRVSLYAELPAGAHLAARPTGADRVRVRVTDEAGAATVAYEGPAAELTAPIALAAARDHVVRIDLEGVGGCARWDGAALGVLDRASPRPPAPTAGPVDNLILLVVDTLRSDRLAAYGPTRVETPRITAAAARGAVFLRNQSMAPSSPPSHATIQTGQIPRVHGITGDDGELGPDTPMLSVLASRAGLYTAYVGNNDFAMSRFRSIGRWDSFETPFYATGKDCGPIIERALAHAAQAKAAGRRFFLSLLPIEPHVAYRFHDGITDRYYPGAWGPTFKKKVTGAQLGRLAKLKLGPKDWDQLRALYDGEVTWMDRCYGALEDGLQAAGLLDRTAIVITSDHGEGQGERGGKGGHAYSLNRELVAVPLIIAGGVPPARVEVPTSNLDIAPTVLALLGLPADPRMQGRDLVPLAHAPAAIPSVVASEYGKSYALRSGRWQLVVGYGGDQHLYDTDADPDEDHDRVGASPIALRYLRDAAGLFLAHRTRWHAATWGGLTDLAPGNPLLSSPR